MLRFLARRLSHRRSPALPPRPQAEFMEPRLLYSADFMPVGALPDAGLPAAEMRSLDDEAQGWLTVDAEVAAPSEILFIDAAVTDADALVAELRTGRPGLEVVWLDAGRDGVEQISEVLARRSGLDAVHIVSHGASGQLQLGNTVLDGAALEAQAETVAHWAAALGADADILLYGCDVGDGVAGERFIGTLASLTGADVAASTNPTGSAQAGGDWVLEQRAGSIESAALASSNWHGSLGVSAISGDIAINSITSGVQNSVAVAMLDNGSWLAAWESEVPLFGQGIYARMFDAGGAAVSWISPVINQTTFGNQTAPDVASDGSGSFVVTWVSDHSGNEDVYMRRFSASGTPLSGEILVTSGNTVATSGNQSAPSVAMNSAGEFVVAWSGSGPADADGVFARRFNADGTPAGEVFKVNGAAPGSQDSVDVAIAADGSFVITWVDGGAGDIVRARTYAADGAAGAIIGVQTTVYGGVGSPSVAMDASGNFAVVWGENGRDLDFSAVLLQQFDANGTKTGSAVTVNLTTAKDQERPQIAMDATGNFVVTWESDGQDGSGEGIYLRSFEAGGLNPGAEIRANGYTAGAQEVPAVALNNAGQFVVAWQGARSGASSEINGKTFAWPDVVNFAPTLDVAASVTLAPVAEDSTPPVGAAGWSVSELVSLAGSGSGPMNVTDPDAGAVTGIALTAANAASGQWRYSIDGGGTWTLIDTATLSSANALLLAADGQARLHYTPNPDTNGTLANALSFRAWDGTAGSNGTRSDTTQNGASTAFSTAIKTASASVTAVNDAPVITSNGGGASASINVAENQTAVTTVTRTDVDGDVAAYAIVGGDDAARFVIDGASGSLRFITAPNREAATDADGNHVYDVVVRVSDGAGGADTQAISVTVSDVDEFNVVAVSDVNASADAVAENAANGTLVGITAFASDADATNNLVTYSLTNSAGGRFAIDAATGVVRVADGSQLDREAAASHSITVKAASSDGSFETQVFTIGVGDVDEFDVGAIGDTDAGANRVAEAAASGTTVGITAFADDADATGDAIIYGLDDTAGGRFAIHAGTGVVTVANGTLLDHETVSSHTITVRATSADGSFRTQALTIDLDDVNEAGVSPVDDANPAADTVPENAGIGTIVGITAAAADTDGSDSVTYSLLDDAGGRFTIDAAGGVIRVAGAIDREAAASHDITVQARSSDGSTSTRLFSIAIGDVDEFDVGAMSDADAAADAVAENAANGTLVGIAALATDADATDNLITYGLLDSAGGRFAIDSSTGAVTVANGLLLDREAAASHDLTVSATSSDGSVSTRTFTIGLLDVNELDVGTISDDDGRPDAVAENLAAGAEVGISARGVDADATNSGVTYSLSGNPDGLFAIDASSGVVTTAAVLDREAVGDVRTIEVTAASADGSVSTHSFTIALIDANDNAPVIVPGQGFTLAENSANGASVGTATATDADTAGSLSSWTITGGTGASAFAIDAATGEITIADSGALDFETVSSLTLQLTVADGVQSAAAQIVTIGLTDVNESPTAADLTATIAEDAARVLTAADFGFSDVDAGDRLGAVRIDTLPAAGSLTLAGVAVTAGQVIQAADLGAGRLVFTPAPDASGTPYASITFTVRDAGGLYDATGHTLTLDVTAANDAPAVSPGALGAIGEDTSRLITLTELLAGASDADGDSLGVLNLALANGSGSLVDNGDGTWTFTPTADWNGTVDFGFDVTDGITSVASATSLDVVATNDLPAITVNQLTIAEGTTVTLNGAMLAAADAESGPAALTFTVDNVSGGFFALAAAPATAVTTFTQAQVDAGEVRFSHDGSETAPGYVLRPSDGSLQGAPSAAAVAFSTVDDAPHVTTPADLAIAAGDDFGPLAFVVGDEESSADALNVSVHSSNQAVLPDAALVLSGTGATRSIDVLAGYAGAAGSTVLTIAVTDGSNTTTTAFTVSAAARPSPVETPAVETPPVEMPAVGRQAPVDDAPPAVVQAPQADEAPLAAGTAAEAAAVAPPTAGAIDAPPAAQLTFVPVTSLTSDTTELATQAPIKVGGAGVALGSIEVLAMIGEALAPADQPISGIEPSSSVRESQLEQAFSQLREAARDEARIELQTTAVATVTGTGLAIGYVAWVIRGGVLVSSLLTTMPAWRLLDPLPILKGAGGDADDEDDDSLQSLVETDAPRRAETTPPPAADDPAPRSAQKDGS